MSERSRRWISATPSGVKRFVAVVHGSERHTVVVERGDRVAQREDLEPAGVGQDQAVQPEATMPRPPSSSMMCSPGLKWRWYVLPRITSAPSDRTSSDGAT